MTSSTGQDCKLSKKNMAVTISLATRAFYRFRPKRAHPDAFRRVTSLLWKAAQERLVLSEAHDARPPSELLVWHLHQKLFCTSWPLHSQKRRTWRAFDDDTTIINWWWIYFMCHFQNGAFLCYRRDLAQRSTRLWKCCSCNAANQEVRTAKARIFACSFLIWPQSAVLWSIHPKKWIWSKF